MIFNNIKTKRLILREFNKTDFTSIHSYASEAAEAIIGFGFKDLNLHKIFATCDPNNIGSAKVLENIGMSKEGRLRRHKYEKGKWRDSFIYSILEQEYGE